MLKIKNISKSYNNRPVLRDISLELQRGEIVGIFGPNGAGKTTCFYIIAGLVSPTKGAVYLDEHEITLLPMYRRARLGISYLPQESSIFRGLTVEENILAVLEMKEQALDKRQAKLEDILKDLQIDHLRHTIARVLSGGERRRVEIARILASQPYFVLLDEPLAGIDPIAIYDIKEMIYFLKSHNIGVLITDHNVRDTFSFVDKAYIIYDGKIIISGDPKMIISNPEVKRVYLGEDFQINLNANVQES